MLFVKSDRKQDSGQFMKEKHFW